MLYKLIKELESQRNKEIEKIFRLKQIHLQIGINFGDFVDVATFFRAKMLFRTEFISLVYLPFIHHL